LYLRVHGEVYILDPFYVVVIIVCDYKGSYNSLFKHFRVVSIAYVPEMEFKQI